MKKKIIASILILGIALMSTLLMGACSSAGEQTQSKEDLVWLINQQQAVKDHSHNMAESARFLGWEEDSELIQDLGNKWKIADANQAMYQNQLDEIVAEEQRKIAEEEAKWAQKESEYPAATYVWKYMKSLGWNDYVCAGIMGNLMAEVGGQTLALEYTMMDHGYYGMCQWGSAYKEIWGGGLEAQCNFLRDTIQYEIDTYGGKYSKGLNFNSFLNMTNEKKAALAFAKSYERCASGSYSVRQKNATKAYKYYAG